MRKHQEANHKQKENEAVFKSGWVEEKRKLRHQKKKENEVVFKSGMAVEKNKFGDEKKKEEAQISGKRR